jgi:Fic family protein
LSEDEALQILSGKTVGGHPVSEVRELINYRSCVEWLIREFDQSPYISLDLILEFHLRLFAGFTGEHGRFKTSANFTYLSDGSRLNYSPPGKVKEELSEWVSNFNQNSLPDSVIPHAARFYYEFQMIHPFADGNGRIGRVLIAYYLAKADLSFSFRYSDRLDHLAALEAGNRGNLNVLEKFFQKRVTAASK